MTHFTLSSDNDKRFINEEREALQIVRYNFFKDIVHSLEGSSYRNIKIARRILRAFH